MTGMATLVTIGRGIVGGSAIMFVFVVASNAPTHAPKWLVIPGVVSGALVGGAVGTIMAWVNWRREHPTMADWGREPSKLLPIWLGVVASCISFVARVLLSPVHRHSEFFEFGIVVNLVMGVIVSPAWMFLAGWLSKGPKRSVADS